MVSPHPWSAPSPTVSTAWLIGSLFELVEAGKLELPLLPDVASQVLSLCNDPNSDARALAALLQRDPALAGHVLRVANSAAFAPREPIVSLQQAVSRLGFSVLNQIAVAVAMKSKVFQVRGFELRLKRIWIHSATSGAWAKEIARCARHNVEGAFLCGLLHDVGKPIVLQASLDLFRKAEKPVESETLEAAMEALHERVGAMLLQTWRMPPWMVAALAHHHDPSAAVDFAQEARTTCLADRLAHWSIEASPERAEELSHHPVVRELNLYRDDWDTLLAARPRVMRVAEAFA